MKRKNRACAALLNPSAAEPLVWPSKLKFINELNQEAKALLERALVEANMEREKAILKESSYSPPSPLQSDAELDDAESEVISIFRLGLRCNRWFILFKIPLGINKKLKAILKQCINFYWRKKFLEHRYIWVFFITMEITLQLLSTRILKLTNEWILLPLGYA